jgi:tagatose-1,6-bisphosphate aldolase
MSEWVYLKEACRIKGVNYRTIARNDRLWQQPNGGVADGILCGRRAWKRRSIMEWIEKDDTVLQKEYRERLKKEAKERVG